MELQPAASDKFYAHAFDALQQHNREYVGVFDEAAITSAKQLLQDGPLANTMVLIPVAAHQEQAAIYPALREYAQQDTRQPFSVVLNMNYPFGANQRAIDASMDQVARVRRDFPDLDVRSLESVYGDPTIGAIRGELWATTLLAAEMGGTVHAEREAIGLNHDIDAVRVPRSYIRQVQERIGCDTQGAQQRMSRHISHYDGSVPIIRPYAGGMKHAKSDEHPNASLATLWADTKVRLSDSYYEAGIVLTLGYYAAKGGFDFTDTSGEMISILERDRKDSPIDIATPALETSPRRYIERLCRDGGGYADIWKDGNFRATEEYRMQGLAYPDMTREQLMAVTQPDVEDIAWHVVSGARKAAIRTATLQPDCSDTERLELYYDQHDVQVRRRAQLAEAVLCRIIGHEQNIARDVVAYILEE